MSEAGPVLRPSVEEIASARRRSHRLSIEARATVLEGPVSRFLGAVARREALRQVDLLRLPRPETTAKQQGALSGEDEAHLQALLESFGMSEADASASAQSRALGAGEMRVDTRVEREVIEAARLQVTDVADDVLRAARGAALSRMEQALSEWPRPTHDELARQVMQDVGELGGMRATIARDVAREYTNYVANAGIIAGYRNAGVLTHSWLGIRDGRSRDSHAGGGAQSAHGLTVPVGEPFTFRGLKGSMVRMRHPGDRSLGAGGEETRYCRCVTQPAR